MSQKMYSPYTTKVMVPPSLRSNSVGPAWQEILPIESLTGTVAGMVTVVLLPPGTLSVTPMSSMNLCALKSLITDSSSSCLLLIFHESAGWSATHSRVTFEPRGAVTLSGYTRNTEKREYFTMPHRCMEGAHEGREEQK